MNSRLVLLFIIIAGLLIVGCSNQGYVDEQINGLRSEMNDKVSKASARADMNADEIKKLQSLSKELSEKTELALNEAKGFENYQVIWEGKVNFDFDSYELTQIAKDDLEGLGKKMVDHPRSLLELIGHTDRSGSAKYNFELGLKRSQSVQRELVDQYSVALYRMYTVSQGEGKPVALPDEKNSNAQNRRVTLKLWGKL